MKQALEGMSRLWKLKTQLIVTKKKFVAKILIHRRMRADYLRGEPERLRERPLGVGLGK